MMKAEKNLKDTSIKKLKKELSERLDLVETNLTEEMKNSVNYSDLNALGRQRTDCFLNNVYFDIKAVRPMSVLGLPQF